jgi:hypothetical protein
LAVLFLTLIAASCAAFFTGRQAWISRDQEHRALRAYVLLKAELQPGSKNDPETPYWVEFTATNMGATPVYYLDINALTQIREEYEGHGPRNELEQAIAGRRCDLTTRDPMSGTFAKTYTHREGIAGPIPEGQVAKFAAGGASVVSFGTACYWDIFRDPHWIRFCFEWSAGVATSPYSCLEHEITPSGTVKNEEEYSD